MAVPSSPEWEELERARRAIVALRGIREPEFTEPAKSKIYDSVEGLAENRNPPTEKNPNDAKLTEDLLRLIASPLTPAIIFDIPPPWMEFFAGLDIVGMGGPMHLAFPAREGVRVVSENTELPSLSENWLLVWFNGAEGWNRLTRGKPWYGNVFKND